MWQWQRSYLYSLTRHFMLLLTAYIIALFYLKVLSNSSISVLLFFASLLLFISNSFVLALFCIIKFVSFFLFFSIGQFELIQLFFYLILRCWIDCLPTMISLLMFEKVLLFFIFLFLINFYSYVPVMISIVGA